MKRIIFTLLALTFIHLANAGSVFTVNGISFVATSDSTAAVTSNNTYSGSINIPSNVTYSDTTYSVTSIGNFAFDDCKKLTSITIPSSVTSIGHYAFFYCTGLTNISIPSSVTSIDDGTFDTCTGLTSITIPSSVKSIGKYAFYFCSKLTNISIPSSVDSIGDNAFSHSGLTNITIPSSVKSIGSYAFYYCTSLTNISIPSSVTSIGTYAFYYCTSLSNISIPSSVTSIGDRAFNHCNGLIAVDTQNPKYASQDGVLYNKTLTKLIQCPTSKTESITLPSSVDSIGNYAFQFCKGLTNISIPSSVNFIGEDAFEFCKGLITVDIQNLNYASLDGVLYNKALTTLIQCPISKTDSFSIPSSVDSIESNAFYSCNNLTSISIPSSVTYIGNLVFCECSGIFTVDAQNPNYTSQDGVLYNKLLTTLIQCPTSKTGSISIPSSIDSIAGYAFYYCNKLTSIYAYSSTPASCGSYSFLFIGCTLYVPMGSKSLYQSANEWSRFNNIVEFDASAVYSPTNTELNMYYDNATRSLKITGNYNKAFISVYDINGRLLLNNVVSSNVPLQMNTLTSGMYIVKALIDNKSYSQKIIVF